MGEKECTNQNIPDRLFTFGWVEPQLALGLFHLVLIHAYILEIQFKFQIAV